MPSFFKLLTRFRKDERGVFGVIFGLIAVVLVTLAGCVVDFSYMQTIRSRAQNALDASALALQAKMSTLTVAQIQTQAQALLVERLADSAVTAIVTGVTKDTNAGKLTLQARLSVPTIFVQLVGVTKLDAQLVSEVTQQSNNLEISVSLDITGSMAATYDWSGTKTSDKIGDLISATKTLIGLVVKDDQSVSYSKMAIVPWSFGANVGSYAASVRGTPTPGVSISSVKWASATIPTVSGITRANPGVITVNSVTGLANNDWIYISGVSGMTQINGKIGQISNLNAGAKTFNIKISGTNLCTTSGCGYSSRTSGGTVTKCLTTSCQEVVTTTSNHGLSTNDYAFVTGSSLSSINNVLTGSPYTSTPLPWQVTSLTSTTYSVALSGPSTGSQTSAQGTSYCTKYGCPYYYFTSAAGTAQVFQPSNCTTERSTNSYSDTAPSVTPLAYNYTSGGAACVSQVIQPLTADKTVLNALADSLVAGGSTSGHLGLAWGWYMISPNFAYLWPTASQPHAYKEANLTKAIVFMTDGAFNSPYCQGVIASDAGPGSGGASSHNGCTAPLGASKDQAQAICDNIKAAANGVTLYVVGFDLGTDADALAFLEGCATVDKFYEADDGAALQAAFNSIGGDLSQLRISK